MNPAALRTDKAQDTQRRIIDASARLFAEKGYRGTSMSDIIAASGSTKGGFYFHFASKAQLAAAVVLDAEEDFQRRVVAAIGEYTRGADQLVALVNVMADSVAEKPLAARLGALCEELRSEPDIDRAALYPQQAWVRLVAGLLTAAGAEDDLEPGVDVDRAAVFAVGAFIGIVDLVEADEDPDAAQSTRALMQFVLRGVGLKSAR